MTWQANGRHFRVQMFASTRRLIWSSWVETSDGPVYDDGFAQPFDAFLRGELPPHDPPEDVRAWLREQINAGLKRN